MCKRRWEPQEGHNPSNNLQPCCTKGVLPGWYPGAHPYHAEGQHSTVWNHKYPQPDRCMRALYMGQCACRAGLGPPAAYLHCTGHHVWGVAPRILLGTNLPEEPGCLPHCGPGQSHCWESHSSQPVATSNPPDRNLGRTCQWLLERLDSGWDKSSGSRGLVSEWAKTDQGAAD